MQNIFSRALSSISRELKPALKTKTLNNKKTKFFKLKSLKNLDEALGEPEDTVACVPLEGATQFEKLVEEVEVLKRKDIIREKDIISLQADVEALKIAPSVIQVYETIRFMEKIFIEKYLSVVSAVIPVYNQKFEYLNQRTNHPMIKEFFEIPRVHTLNLIIETEEFNAIRRYRNLRAHEAIRDDTIEFEAKWNEVKKFFANNIMKSTRAKFNPVFGSELIKLHQFVDATIRTKQTQNIENNDPNFIEFEIKSFRNIVACM